MPSVFKHISQIQTRADYDKLLRKALAPDSVTEGTGPAEEFHYLEEFPFDKKPGALVLVGDISKTLLGELKKLGTGYARGTCRMTPTKRVLVDIETGKVKPKLVNAALKTSGLKLQAVVNGEEPEPDPELGEIATTSETTPQPQSSPPPETTEPNKAPPSPEQLQWMEKVKVLRPAFDKALQLARTTDPRWAEDLDSNFAQMMQQARGGDFKSAMETLKRLAVILRSREAARAEVKHQALKEDPEYAQGARDQEQQRLEQHESEPELMQEYERELDERGLGLTSDGVSSYQKALTLAEWKSGVNEPLKALTTMLKDGRQRDLSYQGLQAPLKTLTQTVGSARTLAMEEDDRPDLQQVTSTLTDSIYALQEALQFLVRDGHAYKRRPETLLVAADDVNRQFQGTLMAMSQLARQGQHAKSSEPSDQAERERRWLESAAVEEFRLVKIGVTQLEQEEHELARKLQKLKDTPLDERLTESEQKQTQEANEDRINDLEEELQLIRSSLTQTRELLQTFNDEQMSEEFRESAKSLDIKLLSEVTELWKQQYLLVHRHIRDAAWDKAVQALDTVNNKLSMQTGELEGGFPSGLMELSGRVSALTQGCADAKRTAEASPAAALKALKPVILGCAEFQRLYFK